MLCQLSVDRQEEPGHIDMPRWCWPDGNGVVLVPQGARVLLYFIDLSQSLVT